MLHNASPFTGHCWVPAICPNKNPTGIMPMGFRRKEELTKRLSSFVNISQKSFKKVPPWKRILPQRQWQEIQE
jgi:hypothetical protein